MSMVCTYRHTQEVTRSSLAACQKHSDACSVTRPYSSDHANNSPLVHSPSILPFGCWPSSPRSLLPQEVTLTLTHSRNTDRRYHSQLQNSKSAEIKHGKHSLHRAYKYYHWTEPLTRGVV